MPAPRFAPWLSLLASLLPAQEPAYRMLAERGGTWDCEFLSLRGMPEAPQAGDYWDHGGLPVLLPEPGAFTIDDGLRTTGELAWVRNCRREIVGLTAARLATADEATLRGLRCVQLDAWSPAIAAALAKVPPAAGIEVCDGALLGATRSLPPLPAQVQCVRVVCVEPGGVDLTPGAQWRDLRVLGIGGYRLEEHEVDLAPFAAARELRVLRVTNGRTLHADVVRGFGQLCEVALSWPDQAPVSALGTLPGLRSISLHRSTVVDLAPLAALPAMSELSLSHCTLLSLGSSGFPVLRELNVLGTGVPPRDVLAFLRTHPACEVERNPSTEELQDLLAKCDRVRVLDSHATRLYADVKDPAEVRRIVGWFDVVRGGDRGHCMCGPMFTFEFQVDGRRVALMGLHHGLVIRWEDGPWRSDARLLPKGADAVVDWLVDRLKLERADLRALLLVEESEGNAVALQLDGRRSKRVAALPPAVFEALADSRSAWDQMGPNDSERALQVLGLLGCHDAGFDPVDENLLSELGARRRGIDWPGIVARAAEDPDLARGLGACFVRFGGFPGLSEAASAALLPIAGPAALAHPVDWHRARAVQILRDQPGEASLQLLRRALAGEFPPRAADPGDHGSDWTLQDATDDEIAQLRLADVAVLAALALLARGDRESLAAIRALATSTGGAAGKALQERLAKFEATELPAKGR